MDKKNMSYIEMMRELDLALPSSLEVDYTKISSEKLYEIVVNYFEKIGILSKVKAEDLEEIKSIIRQYSIYGMKSRLAFPRPEDYNSFDQNNYYIKQLINRLRWFVIKIVCESSGFYHRYESSYDSRLGSVDEVADFVSYENIEKYITDLLFMSKQNRDKFVIEEYHIVDEIFLYFGLDHSDEFYYGDREDLSEAKEKIRRMLSNVVIKSSNFNGRNTGDGYESVTHDPDRFRRLMAESVMPIVKIVSLLTAKKLRGFRKKNEEEQEEKVVSSKQDISSSSDAIVSDVVVDDKSKEETSSLTESDFDNLMLSYEKTQKLMDENKELYRQLLELDKKRDAILKAIEENNEKIREGMPRGSK